MAWLQVKHSFLIAQTLNLILIEVASWLLNCRNLYWFYDFMSVAQDRCLFHQNIKCGAHRIFWIALSKQNEFISPLSFLIYLQHFSLGSGGTWLYHRRPRKQIFNQQQPFTRALIIFLLTLTLWDICHLRVILDNRILSKSWFHAIITVIAIAQRTIVDLLPANCVSTSKW